jgi:glycosyltransferase involved in cell wall biosynthesis
MASDRSEAPRVLIIGGLPFGDSSGTTITLSNLFRGWPKERLAQIYLAEAQPSSSICDNYFYVSPRHAPLQYYPARLLGWNGRGSARGTPVIATLTSARERSRMIDGLYSQWYAATDLSPVLTPTGLREWALDYKPDLVYSMLGNVRLIKLATRIARACSVPLLPHFTDDWAATLYSHGELFGLADRTLRVVMRKLIQLAPFGLGISQEMARAYERRYEIPFSVVTNCVDDTLFAAPLTFPDHGSEINIVYAGGLYLERWRTLETVASAVEVLRRSGVPVRLTIYCPPGHEARYGHAFADRPGVRLGGSIDPDRIPALLQSADVLVHVESFSEKLRQYTRYSLSTKLPQYLATGRPIFAHGPGDGASMAHIRDAHAGLVVARNDVAEVVASLRELSVNPGRREEMGKNGRAFAERNHGMKQVSEHFKALLQRAAETKPGLDAYSHAI